MTLQEWLKVRPANGIELANKLGLLIKDRKRSRWITEFIDAASRDALREKLVDLCFDPRPYQDDATRLQRERKKTADAVARFMEDIRKAERMMQQRRA